MKQSATLIFYASMQGISFEVKKHVTMNKWNKFKVFLFFATKKFELVWKESRVTYQSEDVFSY